MLPILLYKICFVNKYVLDGTVASFTSIKRCHSRICQPHIPEVISIFQSLARVVNNPLVSHLLYLYVTISMVTYRVQPLSDNCILFSLLFCSLLLLTCNLSYLFSFTSFISHTHTHDPPFSIIPPFLSMTFILSSFLSRCVF